MSKKAWHVEGHWRKERNWIRITDLRILFLACWSSLMERARSGAGYWYGSVGKWLQNSFSSEQGQYFAMFYLVYEIVTVTCLMSVIWNLFKFFFYERGKDSFFFVRYEKDNSKVGVSSDYGKQLIVGNYRTSYKKTIWFLTIFHTKIVSLCVYVARVPQQDQILYQTERYHTQTFGYDMPVQGKRRQGLFGPSRYPSYTVYLNEVIVVQWWMNFLYGFIFYSLEAIIGHLKKCFLVFFLSK